jgi:site-specific DNA-methyltransferase (adenine-specific)
MIDLRFGKYADVMGDVTCDSLIVDAPYSAKTHDGHGAQRTLLVAPGEPADNRSRQAQGLDPARRAINYAAWNRGDVLRFVDSWAPRTRGWFVSITDHVLAPHWEDALRAHGRYVFAPFPFVETGSRVRLTGDGPSTWTCWIVVARPRGEPYSKWGTLPGAYVMGADRTKAVVGGKPLAFMRALVRDYSRPGDIVCDPCAGAGTTLLAAAIEGRRAVGSEAMAEHYELARERLARPYTPTLLPDEGAELLTFEQTELFDAAGEP